MNRNRSRGTSSIEFAFLLLLIVPLVLGTMVIGINMITALQTVQVARDAGHMYARGVDFSLLSNRTVLALIGKDLGLTADLGTGSGSAAVILSAITYVGANECAAAGVVDTDGNPTPDCTNFSEWVFTQRLVIGNSSLRQSNFGAPGGVSVDTATGQIALADYVKNSGARATGFSLIPKPGVAAGGLPYGQSVFISEASARAMSWPGVASSATSYSYGMF